MFTLKLYSDAGMRQRIYEVENFTVLRDIHGVLNENDKSTWSEMTAHQKSGDSIRFDIGDSPYEPNGGCWQKAIIENAAGRTTEIIGNFGPSKRSA